MQKRTVKFIGIGGQSTGSGFIYTYLHAHPQTCIPETATRFFSDSHRYSYGIPWYEKRFAACRHGHCRGECAYDYLDTPEAPERIAQSYPDAKLIAVICNPVERLYREYKRAIETGSVHKQVSLAQYIEHYPESLTRGLFGEHLERYYALYSPLRMLVLIHEDRYQDPIAYVQSAYEFLELDSSFVPKPLRRFVTIDPDDPPPRPLWWRLLRIPLAPLRWVRLDRLVRLIYRHTWPPLQRWLVARNVIPAPQSKRIGQPKPAPIDEELRSILHEYYVADVRKVSRLIHRNLNAEWEIEMKH